jgi:hypothetical protein
MGHQVGGAKFLEGQLGVLVNIAPQRNEFIRRRGNSPLYPLQLALRRVRSVRSHQAAFCVGFVALWL